MRDEPEIPAGVRPLDHTADVGLELSASDLVGLFRAAAKGLTWLLLERDPSGPRQERELHVQGDEPAAILRDVLRELLWWHESEGLTPLDIAAVQVGEDHGGRVLDARVLLVADPDPPVREIKGVTLHGLTLRREGSGWMGTVIFDV